MQMFSIEVDEKIWRYLQNRAEPFVDTPNSVLTRILFGDADQPSEKTEATAIESVNIQGLPKSLAQILEVIFEIEANGYPRTEATNRVAQKRGTAPQTITDKYCRQLNKKASEIDEMLAESDYAGFKDLLKNKYVNHHNMIDMFFDSLLSA
jgi:hypothetical protein